MSTPLKRRMERLYARRPDLAYKRGKEDAEKLYLGEKKKPSSEVGWKEQAQPPKKLGT